MPTVTKARVDLNLIDDASWTNFPTMHSQREGGSAVAIPGNKVLVVGGYHSEEKFLKSCAVLDLTTKAWSDYPPMKTARMGCAAVHLEQHNAVVVVGGFQRGRKYLNTVEYLDLSTQRWHRIAPMQMPRAGCAAVTVLGKRVVVLGGWKDGETAVDTVEVLDFSAKQWHFLPEMRTPRAGCSAVAVGSTVMVLGGHTTSGKARGCRSSVECLDLSTQIWTRLPSMKQKRDASACVIVGNCVFVLGGGETSASPLQTVEMLDLETKTWKEAPSMGAKRFGCAAAAIQNLVVVIGGRTIGGKHLDTVEVLRIPFCEGPTQSLDHFLDKLPDTVPSATPDDVISTMAGTVMSPLLDDIYNDTAKIIKIYDMAKCQANEMYDRTVVALKERLATIDKERLKIEEQIEKAEKERDDALLEAAHERQETLLQIQKRVEMSGSFTPEGVVKIEEQEAPSELCCCITGDLMEDPVTAMDGHTYERAAIEAWYSRFSEDQNPSSPLTGEPIPSRRLIPSHNIRSQCKTWRAKLSKGEPEEFDPLTNISGHGGSNQFPRATDRRSASASRARQSGNPGAEATGRRRPATCNRQFRSTIATGTSVDDMQRQRQPQPPSRRGTINSTEAEILRSSSARGFERRTST